jgi:hypothetical protein
VSATTPDELELNKLAALHEVEMIDHLRKVAIDQHATAFRWLLASLLAVNGGGAIAVIGADGITNYWKVFACSSFSAGIVLSLFSAFLSQRFNMKGLPSLSRQMGYWLAVSHDGEFEPEIQKKFEDEFKEAIKHGWIVPTVGWMAAVAFIIGSICVASGMLMEVKDTKETILCQKCLPPPATSSAKSN